MARSTLAEIITRTRLLIGDPLIAGTPPTSVFSDDEIQDALDARRLDVMEPQLSFRGQTGTNATVTYHDYWAPYGDWEDSVVLINAANAIVVPTAADLVRGHWTFTANTIPPIFIRGSHFDLYGAAAALLEMWSAKVALEFDFGVDGQTFDRTGKRDGLLKVAAQYARKAIAPGQRPTWRCLPSEWG